MAVVQGVYARRQSGSVLNFVVANVISRSTRIFSLVISSKRFIFCKKIEPKSKNCRCCVIGSEGKNAYQ
jgi:hypothetical protein